MSSQRPSAHDLLARVEARRQSARRVLERLDLLRRWARYGAPFVVGSVALRVVVRPDIDMEIVTDEPRHAAPSLASRGLVPPHDQGEERRLLLAAR